jgi:hypothetical protein
MIGISGSGNCYVKINGCEIYDNEHCVECSDSYKLNAVNPKQCDLLCTPA